mgnify:CR=1 FL=1
MTFDFERLKAQEWDRIKRHGKPFADSKGEGLLYQGKKHYTHTMMRGPVKHIPPNPPGKLPWEE